MSDEVQADAMATARKIANIIEENDNEGGEIEGCWMDIAREVASAIAAERERCAVAVDELATRARSQKRSAKTKLERESGAVAEFALSAAVTSIRALT